jgi:hypothetical protein
MDFSLDEWADHPPIEVIGKIEIDDSHYQEI